MLIKKFGWFLLSAALAVLLILGLTYVFWRVFPSITLSPFYSPGLFFITLLISIREWKKNKQSSLGFFMGAWGMLMILSLMTFYASRWSECQGLHNAFNSKTLLERSDAVVKVKVISRTVNDSVVQSVLSYYLKGRVAVVKTLLPIKGEIPNRFSIQYPKEYRRDCSGLRKGDIAIVFLKKDRDGFRFLDRLNEQLFLEKETISYHFGPSPKDKMLGEILALTETVRGCRKLDAIDELGNLEDIRAAHALESLSRSDDLLIKSYAFAARIKIRDIPSLNELLSYLEAVKKSGVLQQKDLSYGTRIYPSVTLIALLLDPLNETI